MYRLKLKSFLPRAIIIYLRLRTRTAVYILGLILVNLLRASAKIAPKDLYLFIDLALL